jgi:hypothetical protein
MTPQEVADYESVLKKGAPQVLVFVTEGTDAESYFLNPDHIHDLESALDPATVKEVIERATEISKNNLSLRSSISARRLRQRGFERKTSR